MAFTIDTSSFASILGDSALISVVCMAIVFLMLALLWGIVALFKFLPKEKEKAVAASKASAPVAKSASKGIKLEDIKDDDMMVAALVASIDYHNEIKKDVKVVSVKEI